MIAHIFIAAALGSSYVKIDDLRVDVFSVLEGCDERTDVLEGCSTNQLGCGVFQESVVNLRKLFGLILDSGHFGDFGNLVRAILAHFLFGIQG